MKSRVHYANTENADMYYLVRSRIPDPFFCIDIDGKKTVFLNVLEIDAFKESNTNSSIEALSVEPLWKEAKKIQGNESGAAKLALTLFRKYDLLDQEVEVARSFPLAVADFLRAHGATLVVKHPYIPGRAKKTSEEIQYLRENMRHTLSAFEFIETVLRDAEIKKDALIYRGRELTSEFLKGEVEKILFEKGMDDVEGMIISCGSQAAMPHHKGKGALRPNVTIICDLFFRNRRNRYFGDMTRTYVKGTPTPEAGRMYKAVCSAQDAVFKAIKPGVAASKVFESSAQAIRDVGFDVGDKGYIHGLGHGLGLELHEAPHAGPHSKDILEQGHVLTVEPGLYYPEHGGVRIEDVIAVTEKGYENLTQYHRDWIIP